MPRVAGDGEPPVTQLPAWHRTTRSILAWLAWRHPAAEVLCMLETVWGERRYWARA